MNTWHKITILAVGLAAVGALGYHGWQCEKGVIRAAMPPGVLFGPGDGSSLPQAVVIVADPKTGDWQTARLAWIASRYPLARLVAESNATLYNATMNSAAVQRVYSVVYITLADGESKRIHFDVTGMF